ncbi:hypothetical protein GF362_05845 [Candidatus Dojkabacteria bacterium]|nr:hypothetical protein [Candidatus Dojkabacteria bacterium]
MKLITKILNLLSNSVLVLILFGIVTVPAVTLYALSPRSYESVVREEQEKVLGMSDSKTNEAEQVNFEETYNHLDYPEDNDVFYADIAPEIKGVLIRGFKGKQGYLGKVEVSKLGYQEIDFDLVRIVNNQYKGQNFILVLKINPRYKDFLNIKSISNDLAVNTQFNDDGVAVTEFFIQPLTPMNLGLEIQSGKILDNLEIEIEVREVV